MCARSCPPAMKALRLFLYWTTAVFLPAVAALPPASAQTNDPWSAALVVDNADHAHLVLRRDPSGTPHTVYLVHDGSDWTENTLPDGDSSVDEYPVESLLLGDGTVLRASLRYSPPDWDLVLRFGSTKQVIDLDAIAPPGLSLNSPYYPLPGSNVDLARNADGNVRAAVRFNTGQQLGNLNSWEVHRLDPFNPAQLGGFSTLLTLGYGRSGLAYPLRLAYTPEGLELLAYTKADGSYLNMSTRIGEIQLTGLDVFYGRSVAPSDYAHVHTTAEGVPVFSRTQTVQAGEGFAHVVERRHVEVPAVLPPAYEDGNPSSVVNWYPGVPPPSSYPPLERPIEGTLKALAYDSHGRPHVVFSEWPDRRFHAVCEGPAGPWTVTEIAPLASIQSKDTLLAIGPGDSAHIVLIPETGEPLHDVVTPAPPEEALIAHTEVLLYPLVNDGQAAGFAFTGRPGHTYTLEESTDLQAWSPASMAGVSDERPGASTPGDYVIYGSGGREYMVREFSEPEWRTQDGFVRVKAGDIAP